MLDEPVSCRGINGSIKLSKDKMQLIGGGLGSAQCHEVSYSDVLAVVVERKSIVPFATLAILAFVLALIAKYNALWFVIDLSRTEIFITSIGLGIAILCAIPTILRLMFVNVLVRSSRGPLAVRLVPIRSAKRLARRFSEMSAGS
jgi:hypothetical protein